MGNPANPYSRAIRIGRTLIADGYDVEIAAPRAEGAAEREIDGRLVIRRYGPSGLFARSPRSAETRPGGLWAVPIPGRPRCGASFACAVCQSGSYASQCGSCEGKPAG